MTREEKNKIIDYYNSQMAYAVKSYVKQRLRTNNNDNICILEIGAGTGGTSATILGEIDQYSNSLQYIFTDIWLPEIGGEFFCAVFKDHIKRDKITNRWRFRCII